MNHTKPKHVAVIMDGNRRWAKQNNVVKIKGHKEGVETLKRITEKIAKAGVDYLTVYALSTENLKSRSKNELRYLFSLIEKFAKDVDSLVEKGVKANVIGDISKLPKSTQKELKNMQEKTKEQTKITLTAAINYGGRNEILRATKKIVKKDIEPQEIDESLFEENLDTSSMPDVDLTIRTGGRKRLSNFLSWQTVYSELYFTDVLWPDFDSRELDKALEFFQDTKRNFGA